MKKLKTLQDVAAAAGVSKMTASRALRGEKDVSQKNVEKVREAARDIGYYGNHLAASLSSKRSDLIGVVVPSMANIVFPQVMSGVNDALTGTGFQPVFGVTDYSNDKEYDILRSMLSWRPAGLIVTGLDQPEETLKLLSEADIPVVQIMDSDGDPVDSCVGFSHIQAGRDMASALVSAGCRKFSLVLSKVGQDTRAAKRRTGFLQVLEEHEIELCAEVTLSTVSSVTSGRQLTEKLLTDHPDLDSIYFSNDDLAMGGLCYCIDKGLAVPDDIVLAGFNGLELLEGFPGKIVTSSTARREIGEAAAKLILGSLNNQETHEATLKIIQPSISPDVLTKKSI